MKTNQIKNKFTDENGNDLLNDLNINNKLEEFILEIKYGVWNNLEYFTKVDTPFKLFEG